jgi:hypothetical protein
VGEGRLTTGWGAGRRGRRGNENAETPACAKASAGRRRRGDSSRPASKSGYCGATTLIFRASCGSWRGFRSGLSVVRPTDRRVYPHSTLDGLPRAVDIPTSRDFGRPGRARAPDAGRAKAVSRLRAIALRCAGALRLPPHSKRRRDIIRSRPRRLRLRERPMSAPGSSHGFKMLESSRNLGLCFCASPHGQRSR